MKEFSKNFKKFLAGNGKGGKMGNIQKEINKKTCR